MAVVTPSFLAGAGAALFMLSNNEQILSNDLMLCDDVPNHPRNPSNCSKSFSSSLRCEGSSVSRYCAKPLRWRHQ
eukprot:1291574-Amphidinium_carterae.1